MLSYTWKPRNAFIDPTTTVTLESTSGTPVTMPAEPVINASGITVTVPAEGSYVIRVKTKNMSYGHRFNVNDVSNDPPSSFAGLGSDGKVPDSVLPARLREPAMAALPRRIGNRIALLGDSITNAVGDISASNNKVLGAGGYFGHANVRLRGWFEIVSDGDDLEFGSSGQTAYSMLTTGDADRAAASAADIVMVFAGTNDITAGTQNAPAQIAANLQAIWAKQLAVGKTVIAATILPRNQAGDNATHIQNLKDTNNLIRVAAARTPGVYLCDWYGALLDPATNLAKTSYLADGVHPNAVGASRMGAVLAGVLGKVLPIGVDLLGGDGADKGNLAPSPLLTGTSGTKSGAQLSGNVATSWAAYQIGTPTSVVASKVARTDLHPGEWQQFVITTAAPNNDGMSFECQNTALNVDWAVGDTVYAAIEFESDSEGYDLRQISISLTFFGAGSSDVLSQASNSRNTLVEPWHRIESGVFRTIPMVVPSGTTRLQLKAVIYGAGKTRFGRPVIRKVV